MTRTVIRVLIVEDEPVFAKNMGTYLSRYGYEVGIANSGEAGLSKLETVKPDVIFLNLSMPEGMNGLDALSKIRAIDHDIKVIIMSGHGSPELVVKAIAGGAFRYVTKPFSLSSMRQMVEDAVREHPAA